jgi:hypothetical protein
LVAAQAFQLVAALGAGTDAFLHADDTVDFFDVVADSFALCGQ